MIQTMNKKINDPSYIDHKWPLINQSQFFVCRRYILNRAHLLQTGLYVVQLIGGYVIMLAIMTYSIWIIVGGVLGLGLGYFFFGWYEGNGVQRILINPTSKCGLAVTLDCGFQGREQEFQPLSISDGGGSAADGSIACRCGESSLWNGWHFEGNIWSNIVISFDAV